MIEAILECLKFQRKHLRQPILGLPMDRHGNGTGSRGNGMRGRIRRIGNRPGNGFDVGNVPVYPAGNGNPRIQPYDERLATRRLPAGGVGGLHQTGINKP